MRCKCKGGVINTAFYLQNSSMALLTGRKYLLVLSEIFVKIRVYDGILCVFKKKLAI